MAASPAREPGRIPALRHAFESPALLPARGVVRIPCLRHPDFDKEKVIHFAMAIFWKASVRDWGTKGKTIYVELGDYAEPLRQFVLGAGPFAKNMYLAITIFPPTVPLLGMLMPIPMVQKDFHRFKFYVPGVERELKVGRQVPAEWHEECIATGPLELVSCSPAFAYTMGKNYVDERASARISVGFQKFLKKRGG
jgi:hypothetical protein